MNETRLQNVLKLLREHGESAADQLTKSGAYDLILPTKKPTGWLFFTKRYGVGVAWLRSRPQQQFDSMDQLAAAAATEEGFWGYSQLRGDWYYFYWELD